MRLALCASALAVALTTPMAFEASAQHFPSRSDNDVNKVTISCYRGYLRTVAWDRPNAVFIDDLLQLGYDREMAYVIGERVCKDEYGVRAPQHQRDSLRRILASTPPG